MLESPAGYVVPHVVGLLVVVAGREHVGGLFRAAGDAQVVALLQGVAHGLVDEALGVAVLVEVADLLGGEDRVAAHVGQRLVAEQGVAVGGHVVVEDVGVFDTHLRAEPDARRHFAVAVLGRDEDDAVRRTRAVDGGRTGVLQDVDRCDVVGIQVVHAARIRLGHAVDDQQRRVVAHRVHAADRHVDRRVGRVEVLGLDDEVGGRTLQRLLHVGHGAVLQRIGLDGRHGRDDVAALHLAVTHDHHLVERVGFLFELEERPRRGVRSLHRQGHVAHVGEDDRRTGLDGEAERSVDVRGRSFGRPLHRDVHADQGLAAFRINNSAVDRPTPPLGGLR